jgi:hypothetical protein
MALRLFGLQTSSRMHGINGIDDVFLQRKTSVRKHPKPGSLSIRPVLKAGPRGFAFVKWETSEKPLVIKTFCYKKSSEKPKTADLELGFSLSPNLGKALISNYPNSFP